MVKLNGLLIQWLPLIGHKFIDSFRLLDSNGLVPIFTYNYQKRKSCLLRLLDSLYSVQNKIITQLPSCVHRHDFVPWQHLTGHRSGDGVWLSWNENWSPPGNDLILNRAYTSKWGHLIISQSYRTTSALRISPKKKDVFYVRYYKCITQ